MKVLLTLTILGWLMVTSSGWFVVNVNGDKVAGPFMMVSACNHYAEDLSHRDVTILSFCRYFAN